MDKEKIVELELINQRLSELDQRLQLAQTQQEHAKLALSILDQLSSANQGDELLMPIGNGMFVPVQVTETKQVKVAVGAQTFVDKSFHASIEAINQQITETQSIHTQLLSQYDQVSRKAQKLQDQIERS
jgi:prefoldin alpha subunit